MINYDRIINICNLYFSDKKTGTLALIVELLDMNLYEVIKGMTFLYFSYIFFFKDIFKVIFLFI